MSRTSPGYMRRASLTQQSGMCLSELMVAMAIGTLVLAGSLEALNLTQSQAIRQQRTMAMQQEVRLGLEVFEQEVRMASSSTIVTAMPDRLEFLANVHALRTVTTGGVSAGQTVLPVQSGSGWEAGKSVVLCGSSGCESNRLGSPGQRSQLQLSSPVRGFYPAGASIEVQNRVTYYARMNDGNCMQLMRQIDGGAGALIDNLQSVRFSYWDEWGQTAAGTGRITRVVLDLLPVDGELTTVREVGVRS